MTECLSAEIRDELPDLIHGRLSPARLTEIEAHIASCAQCAAELAVLRSVVSSTPMAPPIDVRRIVAALPVAVKHGLLLHRGNGELPSESTARVGSQSMFSRPALRIAAAVAVVAAGGLSLLVGREVLNPEFQLGRTTVRVDATRVPVTASPTEAPVLPSVTQRAVATSPSKPAIGVGSGLLTSEVQQLSDEHLVALLSEMDDLDAVPAAEPETIAPALAELDTSGASE